MTPFEFLLASFALGAALVSGGIGFLRFRSNSGRAVSTAVALGLLFAISGIAGPRLFVGQLVVIIAMAVVVALTTLVVRGLRALATRPGAIATATLIAGFTVAGVGTVIFDRWTEYDDTKNFERMMDLISQVPDLKLPPETWVTDAGTALNVRIPTHPRTIEQIRQEERFCLDSFQWSASVIERRPADDRSNCHGWVFTGGVAWVLGEDVPRILRENGYLHVENPKPGDIAIYRGEDGTYRHTALVRSVGDVTIVESKWGWMGVYLHEVNRSCYGTQFEYFRSPRRDHIVAHVASSDLPQLLGGAE
jgi:hypothetical protein